MEYWPPPIAHGWPTATLAKHAAPVGGAGVTLGVVVGALVVVGVGVTLGVVVGARVVVGVGGGVAGGGGGGGGGGGAAPAWYQGVSPTVLCSHASFAHNSCDAQGRSSACAACSMGLHSDDSAAWSHSLCVRLCLAPGGLRMQACRHMTHMPMQVQHRAP